VVDALVRVPLCGLWVPLCGCPCLGGA